MPIVKLSPHFISNNLQCPEDKRRIEYVSEERSGLYIEVRATRQGEGTFYLRYKNDTGKTCHQKLGRTTDVSLANARKMAKKLKAEIALGADPRRDEKARKAVPTLTAFMEEHYIPYVKPRKKTWWKDRDLFRLRLKKVLGHKRINQINRREIQAFHTAVRDEGKSASTCNHYIKMLRHALNLAVDWDMLEKNPTVRVPLFREDNQVEHYMNEAKLDALLTVLKADRNRPVCAIALFLLSTGARLNEALRAEWRHLDCEHKLWRIPAINSKSRKVRAVPLNDSALDVINQLDTEDGFEHLFINRRTGAPFTTIYKTWVRLRNEAGLPHLRIHDLRHQYASFLVNSGRTLYEVQAILGHSDPTVTQRYAHLSTTAMQDAAESASNIITEAMQKSA